LLSDLGVDFLYDWWSQSLNLDRFLFSILLSWPVLLFKSFVSLNLSWVFIGFEGLGIWLLLSVTEFHIGSLFAEELISSKVALLTYVLCNLIIFTYTLWLKVLPRQNLQQSETEFPKDHPSPKEVMLSRRMQEIVQSLEKSQDRITQCLGKYEEELLPRVLVYPDMGARYGPSRLDADTRPRSRRSRSRSRREHCKNHFLRPRDSYGSIKINPKKLSPNNYTTLIYASDNNSSATYDFHDTVSSISSWGKGEEETYSTDTEVRQDETNDISNNETVRFDKTSKRADELEDRPENVKRQKLH